MAGLKIDFTQMLITFIHERAFKSSTTYPFARLNLHLFRDAGMPIWNSNTLCTPGVIVDIRFIRDVANIVAPRRGPRVEL